VSICSRVSAISKSGCRRGAGLCRYPPLPEMYTKAFREFPESLQEISSKSALAGPSTPAHQ
jgi:hypothetical protein